MSSESNQKNKIFSSEKMNIFISPWNLLRSCVSQILQGLQSSIGSAVENRVNKFQLVVQWNKKENKIFSKYYFGGEKNPFQIYFKTTKQQKRGQFIFFF